MHSTVPFSILKSITSAPMPAFSRATSRPATSRPESVLGISTSDGPTAFAAASR
jgi:hypothetical protein